MQKSKKRNLAGVLFLVFGILFLLTGIYRKEQETVGQKSNMICLECVGIG